MKIRTTPAEQSPEEVTAQRKLDRILDPNLQEFGIRFYNLEEYKRMLSQRTIQGKEVSLYGSMWREDQTLGTSCKDFIEHGSVLGWGAVAHDFTKWPLSSLQATLHTDIQKLLPETDAPNKVAEYILEFRKKYPYYCRYIGILPEIDDAPKTAEAVRAMLQTIRDVPGGKGDYSRGDDNPYHVGVIFNKTALNLTPPYTERLSENVIWQTFSREESHNGDLVLGAISLFDDNELNSKLKELATSKGAWAHPFFDTHGRVLFPEN